LAQTSGLIQTIQEVHFNDMYPQNKNVKLKSAKRSLAERFIDAEWRVEPMQKPVNALIRNGWRLLVNVWRPDGELFARALADDELMTSQSQWMADIVDCEGTSRKSCIVRAQQEVRAILLSSRPKL
jgi:hypothetical protein